MSRCFARSLVLRCNMIVALCGVGCGGAADVCVRDSECESGFCRADGTCGPAVDGDAMPPDGAPTDGTSELCSPNHDGSIARTEVPLAAGKMANFRIATDATFNTAGTAAGNGTRTWNLDLALANDADKQIALLAPTGQWWAASFPTASYAVTLAEGSDLLGVFEIDDTALTLLGVVSPEDGSSRTELAYDPPAKILQFPLVPAATWTTTSTVTGTAAGVLILGGTSYTEQYDATVDITGTMTTPYGDFPVLRVATDLDRRNIFAVQLEATRSFAWIAECFGSVANATSQSLESAQEFSDPAEVRRITP
jgi:hypothetical protein